MSFSQAAVLMLTVVPLSPAQEIENIRQGALQSYEECVGDSVARISPSSLTDVQVITAVTYLCSEKWSIYEAFTHARYGSKAAGATAAKQQRVKSEADLAHGLKVVRDYLRTHPEPQTTE